MSNTNILKSINNNRYKNRLKSIKIRTDTKEELRKRMFAMSINENRTITIDGAIKRLLGMKYMQDDYYLKGNLKGNIKGTIRQ